MSCVHCSRCGKRVSNELLEEILVRAWVECPECIEKQLDMIEDTPETVRAAFIADAEASGVGESIRSRIEYLHGYGGRVYEIAEESAIETLDALGLSALLAEPKPKEETEEAQT